MHSYTAAKPLDLIDAKTPTREPAAFKGRKQLEIFQVEYPKPPLLFLMNS
jgi:hypothetical protein